MPRICPSWLRWLALSVLALAAVVPFWWIAVVSVRADGVFSSSIGEMFFPSRLTIKYYCKLWEVREQLPLLRFFGNSLLLTAGGVLLEVALASMAAFPLARRSFWGKSAVAWVLAAALMLPTQANQIVNFTTVRFLGLYDTWAAVVLPGAVSVFGILLMRQAFLVVPAELEDAARLDGCGEWGIFWHIMLPLTRASQATLALFAAVANWNSFLWPLVVLKSNELYPLSVGLAYLSETFDSDFRLVAAGTVMGMLPLILVFFAIQKQFIKGLTAGALK
ncbi:MAG: carbohydrate ABC transporter permease [bacterium]|nr:carbohydrate ABC transporter permease [bacterium]